MEKIELEGAFIVWGKSGWKVAPGFRGLRVTFPNSIHLFHLLESNWLSDTFLLRRDQRVCTFPKWCIYFLIKIWKLNSTHEDPNFVNHMLNVSQWFGTKACVCEDKKAHKNIYLLRSNKIWVWKNENVRAWNIWRHKIRFHFYADDMLLCLLITQGRYVICPTSF